MQKLLNSKFSVRLSILIGKNMPQGMGAWIIKSISSIIGSIDNLDINRSISSNQSVVSSETLTDPELAQRTKQVLSHAGRCYYDLYH